MRSGRYAIFAIAMGLLSPVAHSQTPSLHSDYFEISASKEECAVAAEAYFRSMKWSRVERIDDSVYADVDAQKTQVSVRCGKAPSLIIIIAASMLPEEAVPRGVVEQTRIALTPKLKK